jgi:hypothetical protein
MGRMVTAVAQAIPNCQLIKIPDAAHDLPNENPRGFIRAHISPKRQMQMNDRLKPTVSYQYFLSPITKRVNPSAASRIKAAATSNASLLIWISKLNNAIPRPSVATIPTRSK